MMALAVLFSGLAAWLWGRPRVDGRARLADGPIVASGKDWRRHAGWLVPAALVIVVLGWIIPFGSVAVAAVVVSATTLWMVAAHRRDQRSIKRTKEVARACQVLESLLVLGHVPSQAIAIAAEECPILARAAAAQRIGGDLAEVLSVDARRPGAHALGDLAQALRVSERTGAPLHSILERVRLNVDEEADLATVVAGELASSKATIRMLAVLPLLGIGAAFAIGADPLGFFTGNGFGRLCLIGGVGLLAVGVIWSDRMAIRAVRPPQRKSKQNHGSRDKQSGGKR
ncbi:MAG: hypothetical protein LBM23_09945 [Propionibacteriaceae bacterium]|jgi:tight adherence protein B|nr:hypothetical protein [Propionibacteriaceae bacterium]